jgi:hypothetical protein
MPRSRRVKAQNLTAKEKEKYFISLYVKEGAIEEKIPYAERRASLKPGAGHRILKRKKVQQDIKARMEPVRLEQMRQSMIGQAVAVATTTMQEELIAEVDAIRRTKTAPEILEHVLMCGVIGLDWQKHPKKKLDTIIAAFVVKGILETGKMRRVRPPENTNAGAPSGLYTSLSKRPPVSPSLPVVETSPAPQERVCSLFPQPPQKDAGIASGPLAAPGESIDAAPATTPKSQRRVITVEVG